jgi:ElaB/YqjD/DUF883 family membrane-anchored ribosome-binding protein
MNFSSTGNEKVDQALVLLMQASRERQMGLGECIVELGKNFCTAEALAEDKIKESVSSINNHVHKRPWIYIATAALGGFVIGLFCRRP